MIVQHAWITKKKVDLNLWNYKITKWRGLFLFGFIPLYMWVVEYEYGR